MMARRTILAALATAATTPAFAQSKMGRTSGGEHASGLEAQLIQRTTKVGSLSLALSRLAEQKVLFPKLKEFSQFEVAEQETVADVMKSLQKPGPVNGTVTPPSEAEVDGNLDQHDRETVQKMRAAQAGAEFDREYLDAEIEGHHQLLRTQEDYLKSGRALDSINFAKLASGMIKEHLQLLADVKTEMGSQRTQR